MAMKNYKAATLYDIKLSYAFYLQDMTKYIYLFISSTCSVSLTFATAYLYMCVSHN